MNYYEHHIGDYDADTAHLSWIEDMAYTRLLRLYYRKEAPIPAAVPDACRLVRALTKEHKQAVESVLLEFFTLADDGWHQTRCDGEVTRYQAKAERNREVGKLGGRPRKVETQKEPPGLFVGSQPEPKQNPLQSPDTRHQEETSNLPVAGTRPSPEVPSLALVADAGKEPPSCPHLEVLALWAEVLPAMPQHLPSMWKGQRADHLRVRWRETAVEKGWGDKAQGIAYFRKLFAYVGQSAFLMGRTSKTDKRPFVIELEWLVLPTNWAKVIEGKYHQEAA